ncbi:MAG: DEAD/DEAH box helicase [Vicinamibacterales bacterium]
MLPSIALAREFDPAVRTRGDEYARRGAVEIVSGSRREVAALVQGHDSYAVLIARTGTAGRAFSVTCTCPYFMGDRTPCKHIWATLRVAEQRGHLIEAEGGTLAQGTALLTETDAELALDRAGLLPGSRPDPSATPSPSAAFLSHVQQQLALRQLPAATPFPYSDASLLYVVDRSASLKQGLTVLHVMYQRQTRAGRVGRPKIAKLSTTDIARAPATDRRFLALISGAPRRDGYDPGYELGYGASRWRPHDAAPSATFLLPDSLTVEVLPLIARNARAWILQHADAEILPLPWDDGPAWRFHVTLEERSRGYLLSGELVRTDTTLSIAEPHVILGHALIVARGALSRYESTTADVFLTQLQKTGPIEISMDEKPTLAQLLARSGAPMEAVPEALRLQDIRIAPVPRLSIQQLALDVANRIAVMLSFDYDGSLVAGPLGEGLAFDIERQRVVHRNAEAEASAVATLHELGLRPSWQRNQTNFELPARDLTDVVRALMAARWQVEAEGRRYRAPSAVALTVTSGIDWFDLAGTVQFGDAHVPIVQALAALNANRATVRLDDGTLGLLPEDWLARYGPLTSAGEIDGERVRFTRQQASLLDALLAGREADAAIRVDEAFDRIRQELARFERIEPVAPPPSFQGTLRPYQLDGLGWFGFLRQFGFGGCLADDMGLGKTIMVLALLEERRLGSAEMSSAAPPVCSLVVVPRSLIGNWIAEARRFTPGLRVVDYSHASRGADVSEALAGCDVALVTYGTLRRDIGMLSGVEFDYVILDEAQAIKNAATASAKAARLLRARHRLVLSGTPIENHLGELWSLFEFLNPGVLGRSTVFQRATGMVTAGADVEMTKAVARGLRPFILRRTKEQVARDLPSRTEQTIACELSARERSIYEALRRQYRGSVLERIERVGLAKSKMHVLEALLRLRQASCHPGLIYPARKSDSSAKFDVLVPRLAEVLAEGHKALVFSQFTTLLGLLRTRLDTAGVTYEYLDGRTRDREERVRRFQEDASVGVFLISLKAGGVGLNLTAAEYVFLLDPWWNPAVEAQAIDRAHRIGQTREVFAYRLIAKDTIEEKVLQLQQSKRELADAVLSADAVGLRRIGREDLELLLS